MGFSDNELLNFAIENGIIDVDTIQKQVEMNKQKKYLEMHQYDVWQGKNGKWYTYLPDTEKGRKLIKRNCENDILVIIINFYQEKECKKEKTFFDCFLRWKDVQKEYGISDSTINKYESDYRRFFEYDEINDKPISDIDDVYLESFIFRLFDRLKVKYQAFCQMFGMINGIMKRAKKDKIITDNPCEYIEPVKYRKRCEETVFDPRKRVLDNEGLSRVLTVLAKDFEEKPEYIPSYSVQLALLTGLRAGELAFLQWEHIKVNEGYIHICGSEKWDQKKKIYWDDKTKTKKERYVPLTQEIIDFLEKLKEVQIKNGFLSKYVFSNENGRIHRNTLISCGRNKCAQAGTSAQGLQVARRTLNSNLRTYGVSTVVASSILGHSQEVNERYYTYDTSNMEYKSEMMHRTNEKILKSIEK